MTALGDTLVLGQGLRPEDSPVVAFLVASRFYHPSVAALVSFFLGFVAFDRYFPVRRFRQYGFPLMASLIAQFVLGGANVYLQAPIWLQLVHLLISNVVWVAFLLLAVTALKDPDCSSPLEQ